MSTSMRRPSFLSLMSGFGALAAISRNWVMPAFAAFDAARPSGRRYRLKRGIHPPNNTGWWRARADISPPPEITERMLMRHGWYRRQKRYESAYAGYPPVTVHPERYFVMTEKPHAEL